MIKSKGLVGTLGVHTNLASLGCVRSASSVCVVLVTIKMPLSVKCKCPHKVIVHPSKKSYDTKGTRAFSKYLSQSVGHWENLSLIESMNDDSKQPKGNGVE
jgi:hypothetical protein